jgi:hypothetical protein
MPPDLSFTIMAIFKAAPSVLTVLSYKNLGFEGLTAVVIQCTKVQKGKDVPALYKLKTTP